MVEHYAASGGHDGALAPGDSVDLEVTIRNDGIGTTHNLIVALEPTNAYATVETQSMTIPAIGERAKLVLPQKFSLKMAADAPCGKAAALGLTATTAEGPG